MLLELWAVPIDLNSCTREDVLDLAQKHLPANAVARLERFSNPDDAYRSLVGRLLPRAFLQTHNLLHHAIFSEDQYGRPSCHLSPSIAKQFDFNISHDGRWVAAAFALSPISTDPVRVGVDVMSLKMPWQGPVNELYEAMQPLMSAEEQEVYRALGQETDSLRHLISLWAHKEAFAKCQGAGLKLSLAEYSISLPTGTREANIRHLGQSVDMHWVNHELSPGYTVCSVATSNQSQWDFRHVSARSLIEASESKGV